MPGSTPQSAQNFEGLYEQARQSDGMYGQYIENFLDDLKARYPGKFDNVRFEHPPVKKYEDALRKVGVEYDGNFNRITDLVRGRLIVDNPEQIQIIRDELAAKSSDFVRVKDGFSEPNDTHFRAINSTLRLPNGHVAELRFEHAGMSQADKKTHALYRERQLIEAKAHAENRPFTDSEKVERDRLLNETRAIHDSAAKEAGLDVLLNEKGRAKVSQTLPVDKAPSTAASPDKLGSLLDAHSHDPVVRDIVGQSLDGLHREGKLHLESGPNVNHHQEKLFGKGAPRIEGKMHLRGFATSDGEVYIATGNDPARVARTATEEALHNATGKAFGNKLLPYTDDNDPRKAILEKALDADSRKRMEIRKELGLNAPGYAANDLTLHREIPVKILVRMNEGTWNQTMRDQFPEMTRYVEEVFKPDLEHYKNHGRLPTIDVAQYEQGRSASASRPASRTATPHEPSEHLKRERAARVNPQTEPPHETNRSKNTIRDTSDSHRAATGTTPNEPSNALRKEQALGDAIKEKGAPPPHEDLSPTGKEKATGRKMDTFDPRADRNKPAPDNPSADAPKQANARHDDTEARTSPRQPSDDPRQAAGSNDPKDAARNPAREQEASAQAQGQAGPAQDKWSRKPANHYEALGIKPGDNPTQADIDKAYAKAAREYHPDLNPDHKDAAHERIKKINEAYETLKDPQKRKTYDWDIKRNNPGGPDPAHTQTRATTSREPLAPRSRMGTFGNAAGATMGTLSAFRQFRSGDNAGGTLAAADAVVNTVVVADDLLVAAGQSSGRIARGLGVAGKYLGPAGLILTAATTGYEAYKIGAEGAVDMKEQFGGLAVHTGVGLAGIGAGAGLAALGVSTGGAAIAVAVGIIAVEKTISAVDHWVDPYEKNRFQPDFANKGNLKTMSAPFHDQLVDPTTCKIDPKTGKPDLSTGHIDWSNLKTLRKLEGLLEGAKAEAKQRAEANDGVLGKYGAIFSDSWNKNQAAKSDMQMADSALAELVQHRDGVLFSAHVKKLMENTDPEIAKARDKLMERAKHSRATSSAEFQQDTAELMKMMHLSPNESNHKHAEGLLEGIAENHYRATMVGSIGRVLSSHYPEEAQTKKELSEAIERAYEGRHTEKDIELAAKVIGFGSPDDQFRTMAKEYLEQVHQQGEKLRKIESMYNSPDQAVAQDRENIMQRAFDNTADKTQAQNDKHRLAEMLGGTRADWALAGEMLADAKQQGIAAREQEKYVADTIAKLKTRGEKETTDQFNNRKEGANAILQQAYKGELDSPEKIRDASWKMGALLNSDPGNTMVAFKDVPIMEGLIAEAAQRGVADRGRPQETQLAAGAAAETPDKSPKASPDAPKAGAGNQIQPEETTSLAQTGPAPEEATEQPTERLAQTATGRQSAKGKEAGLEVAKEHFAEAYEAYKKDPTNLNAALNYDDAIKDLASVVDKDKSQSYSKTERAEFKQAIEDAGVDFAAAREARDQMRNDAILALADGKAIQDKVEVAKKLMDTNNDGQLSHNEVAAAASRLASNFAGTDIAQVLGKAVDAARLAAASIGQNMHQANEGTSKVASVPNNGVGGPNGPAI